MSQTDFPIVGIGASAGGLKALSEFFDHLPADTGMAFIVIIHLAPDKTSNLDQLLSSHTSMKVQQVNSTTRLEPNCVYVISPNKQLRVSGSQLLLENKVKSTQPVIDVFFQSMAEECEKRAIGIVLSGTGSDGTLGLKSVKEYGGLMMAQEPGDAEFSGMPLSAIETNLVDFVLPANDLAGKVAELNTILGKVNLPLKKNKLPEKEESALREIFKLLSKKKSHDFSHYKRSSILRRLQRRLYVTNRISISQYSRYLAKNPSEIDLLFDDLLISVTRFFRDSLTYEKLQKQIIPKLFNDKTSDDPLRVWVVGCATGEEIYSLAILLHEYASKLDSTPQIKIFGTDISESALNIARRGVYPKAIVSDVSDQRLKKYFIEEKDGYRVKKNIRNLVLISKHNILADPPFVKQDLISCRNLLIYFDKKLQRETLKVLHHSLNDNGFLFIGSSDSTITATDYFNSYDKSSGIYQSRIIPESKKGVPLPLMRNMGKLSVDWPGIGTYRKNSKLEEVHNSLLVSQYAPPSVIVDENNQVLHSSSGISRYLQYSQGEPSRNLFNMVSAELRRPLQNILFQYNKLRDGEVISKKIKVERDGELQSLTLHLRPVKDKLLSEGFRQIVFEENAPPESMHGNEQIKELQNYDESELVRQLEKELEQARDQLRQVIEEYEASNEELMASNEELQSINEELQTTTEELETSKEELQSVNEELKIVNEEREGKIEELQGANDDLKNLMNATEIGIMFVSLDLKVNRFTTSTKELFNVIESDLGRPLSHITHHIKDINISRDIQSMLNTLEPVKKVVQSDQGRWYVLRIKPYKTTEHEVEGAVLTFLDITDLKRAEEMVRKRAENEESLVSLGIEYLQYDDPKNVLNRASRMLKKNLNFNFVILLTFDKKRKKLRVRSGFGWSKKQKQKADIDVGTDSVFDYVLTTKTPVVLKDADTEDRFTQSPWLKELGIKSGITAAISGSKSNFGILGVYSKEERSFAQHDVNFIQNTAYRIGEALERIETEEKLNNINKELQDKIEVQKKLQQDVLREDKKERWGVGQFLHDEISQNLLAIKLLLNSKKFQDKLDDDSKTRIEEIEDLIFQSLDNTRELSHFVLPLGGNIGSATDALNLLVQHTKTIYDTDINLTIENSAGDSTDSAVASTLYYIAQEAVTNAIRHGKANSVDIHLTQKNQVLIITIEDDGIGYNEEESNYGQGINIMKYRAELLGGQLDITGRSSGRGTVVQCHLPIPQNNVDE